MLSIKEEETLSLGQDLSSAKFAVEGINILLIYFPFTSTISN
jgi:hypothetical protein